MLVRERAAGCVSTEICHSKNGNKDTNRSKGVNLLEILDTPLSDPPFAIF